MTADHIILTRTGESRFIMTGQLNNQVSLSFLTSHYDSGGCFTNSDGRINQTTGHHPMVVVPIRQGSQPLWKSGKTLKMRGKRKKINQGKLREFVTVTQKGKVFTSLGYVRLVPCVQAVSID